MFLSELVLGVKCILVPVELSVVNTFNSNDLRKRCIDKTESFITEYISVFWHFGRLKSILTPYPVYYGGVLPPVVTERAYKSTLHHEYPPIVN